MVPRPFCRVEQLSQSVRWHTMLTLAPTNMRTPYHQIATRYCSSESNSRNDNCLIRGPAHLRINYDRPNNIGVRGPTPERNPGAYACGEKYAALTYLIARGSSVRWFEVNRNGLMEGYCGRERLEKEINPFEYQCCDSICLNAGDQCSPTGACRNSIIDALLSLLKRGMINEGLNIEWLSG